MQWRIKDQCACSFRKVKDQMSFHLLLNFFLISQTFFFIYIWFFLLEITIEKHNYKINLLYSYFRFFLIFFIEVFN